MNVKALQIGLILILMLAVLTWMRSEGRYDFDIRSVIPFMHGEVTLYDWGGLAIILFGLWGLGRLRDNVPRSDRERDSDFDVVGRGEQGRPIDPETDGRGYRL